MARSKRSASAKKVTPCDICGSSDWPYAIATCCICHKSREHIYCMRPNLTAVPEKWICEACLTREDSNVREPAPRGNNISSSVPPHKEGNIRISNRNIRGKVKFLSTEDACRLSAGVKANKLSKKIPVSVAEASQKFSETVSTSKSFESSTSSVLGSGQLNTSLQPRLCKPSPQWHVKKPRTNSPACRPPSNSPGHVERVIREKPKETQFLRGDKPAGKVIQRLPNEDVVAMKEAVNVSPLFKQGRSSHDAGEKRKQPELWRTDKPTGKVNRRSEDEILAGTAVPDNVPVPYKQDGSSHVAGERPKEPQLLRTDNPTGQVIGRSRDEDRVILEEPVNVSVPSKQGGSSHRARGKRIEPRLSRKDGEVICKSTDEIAVGTEEPNESIPFKQDGSSHAATKKFEEPELSIKEKPMGQVNLSQPFQQFESSKKTSSSHAESSMLSKFEGFPDNIGAGSLWMGSFEVSNGTYEELQAHPPGKIHPKAYKFAKGMPTMLKFDLCARSAVWPDIFQVDCPTQEDVALYFLPRNFGRSKENYDNLLEFIEVGDFAMQSSVNGVELLLFTSKQLAVDSRRTDMKIYLWGIFRSSRKSACSSPTPLRRRQQEEHVPLCFASLSNTNVSNSEEVSMEIDMVGGVEVGEIDKPVLRQHPEQTKVKFKLQTPKRKCLASNAFDRNKNSDQSVSPKTDPRNALDSPGFPVLERPLPRAPNVGQNLASPPGLVKPLKNGGVEVSGDVAQNGPTGFSRPVTGYRAHNSLTEKQVTSSSEPRKKNENSSGDTPRNRPMENPLARMATIARDLETPPGFRKPFQTNERNESFEVSNGTAWDDSHGFLKPVAGNVAPNGPPGFSRPAGYTAHNCSTEKRVTGFAEHLKKNEKISGDAPRNKPMENPLAGLATIARHLESPPGFLKSFKTNERNESFEVSNDVPHDDPRFSKPVPANVAQNGPPGFSRPVTGYVAHNGSREKLVTGDATLNRPMEKSLARTASVATDLESPPGFAKPYKPNERNELSETTTKKEKADVADVNVLSSSKMRNIRSMDPSKSPFKSPNLQAQRSAEVLQPPGLPPKSHQVTAHRTPTSSVATENLPLSRMPKKVTFADLNGPTRKRKDREGVNVHDKLEHKKNEPSKWNKIAEEFSELFTNENQTKRKKFAGRKN